MPQGIVEYLSLVVCVLVLKTSQVGSLDNNFICIKGFSVVAFENVMRGQPVAFLLSDH